MLRLPTFTRPMSVIASLLLAVVAWQDPSPPHVALPEGWHVHYWSSVGYDTGAILGPNGEEIIFPGYGGTGEMAATTREADPTALLVETSIDGRRVDVAVRADGFLAVSYPALSRPNLPHWHGFDYWTHTKSPRQTATALGIALTRLDVLRAQDRDKEGQKQETAQFGQPSAEFPFVNLSLVAPFGFVGPGKLGRTGVKGTADMIVEPLAAPSSKSKWEDKCSLLGREVRWGEDDSGRLWAAAADSGVKSLAFVSSAPTSQGMVLAMVMALTHKN